MQKLVFFLFICNSVWGSFWGLEHYPEERIYTSSDRGLRPYRALSLYKTATFALTFDDGPHPELTPRLLDVLKRHDVKATFFVLTEKINEQTFPIIKRILDEGHLLASHGPNHVRSSLLTQQHWKKQTRDSFMSLSRWAKLAGHSWNKFYYRFPYGEYGTRQDYHTVNALRELSIEMLGQNCVHMAFWDIDTSDWVKGMTAEDIAQNIISHYEGGRYWGFKKIGNEFVKTAFHISDPPQGGVVLQHDVHSMSVEATDLFIEHSKSKGYKLVRLDEIDEFLSTKDCQL
jgi:peptidoglycan-N-acetylglucosamine deacetylase